MASADISIRSATPADAAQIAEFARTSFRTTYSPTHDPDRMRVHLATVLSDERFVAALGSEEFLVADSAGTILAFAQLRRADVPVRSEPVEDRFLKTAIAEPVATPFDRLRANGGIELRRFYVERRMHGSGLAQRLFDAVASCARAMDGNVLWLGVFPGNARAIAFYKRQGFAEIGRVAYSFVDQTEEDLALALSLNANSA